MVQNLNGLDHVDVRILPSAKLQCFAHKFEQAPSTTMVKKNQRETLGNQKETLGNHRKTLGNQTKT